MAAVLAGGRGAVLSHRSAAAHWGIRPSREHTVDVTRARANRKRPGIRFHRLPLPEDEITTLAGIPITGLSRTLFDLAGVTTVEDVAKAFHEAEVRRLTDCLSVNELLRRYPRRTGAPTMRAALTAIESGLGVTRGELEARFARFLERERLPAPRRNATISVEGRFVEGDCVWDEARLIVELDGEAVHGTRHAFQADRERDRILVAAGWRVIHVTWRQLHAETKEISSDIEAALRRG